MPAVSKAQFRALEAKAARGEISREKLKEFTPRGLYRTLPERASRKGRRSRRR